MSVLTIGNRQPQTSDVLLALEATQNELTRVERYLTICVERLGGNVVIDDEEELKPRRLTIGESPKRTVLRTD